MTERTVEQEPAFAVRVVVDVADKALSAAINDPTTAVQVLDHLEEVMRLIGATGLGAQPTRRVAAIPATTSSRSG